MDINELMKMRFSSGSGAQDLLADKLDVRLVKMCWISYINIYSTQALIGGEVHFYTRIKTRKFTRPKLKKCYSILEYTTTCFVFEI